MSESLCQLEDFHITALSVQWHDPKTSGNVPVNYQFSYDVGQHQTDKLRYRLKFRVRVGSETPEPVGYSLASEIVGFFRFPEGVEQSKIDYLVRVNGCTILYGILRGQVATLTGCYPQKKLVLETIMMRDVVDSIEKEKQAEIKKAKPGKRKRLKA
jgi:preprotein translocase subunit SecB